MGRPTPRELRIAREQRMASMSPEEEFAQLNNALDSSVSTIVNSEKRALANPDLAPFASEFMGTFLLCLTIGLSAGLTKFAHLAIGSSLMVGVFMGGHISGAHYNPAVTLSIWLTGHQKHGMFGMGPGSCACFFVVAQMLGSLAAGMVSYFVTMDVGVKMGKPSVAPQASLFDALCIETLFTFFLALVVLNVACAKANEGKSFYGTAIGFMLFVATTVGGPVSGGAFNPAVGTGLPLWSGHWSAINDIWIYWLGPCVGATLASIWYSATVEM